VAFALNDGVLHAEGVALPAIAERIGTPVYVYSAGHIRARFQELERALAGFPHELNYAVKANSSVAILQLMRQLGAGFDIVSGGELQRVLAAGGDPARVVFSGVGKSTAEIDLALKHGVGCFNVESAAELARIGDRARLLERPANIAVRINPDVDARTHPYISTGLKENKFGVPADQAVELYERIEADPFLRAHSVACHIGSQINSVEPFVEALDGLLAVVDQLARRAIRVHQIDLGGGFGISYRNEPPLDLAAYGEAVGARLAGRDLVLAVEPGRFLVGDAGVLLTRIEYLKPQPTAEHRNFAVIDAAMNDLIRPALYQAWHAVERVEPAPADLRPRVWDIVGPICESGDFIARDRHLPLGGTDLLAIRSAGAYGMVQSSNYNSRPRAAEVLVDGDGFRVIRRRETIRDQLALEACGEQS
jgi:diaminopimelate decarboxylase